MCSEEETACQVLLSPKFPGLGSLAYAPHGPLISGAAGPGALGETARSVASFVKGRGAFLLQVEPRIEEERGLEIEGFVRRSSSIQPRCTLVVPVLEDPDEQLAALPKDTRYGVRRAGREGVEAHPSENIYRDLEEFLSLLEQTAKRQRFALRSREWYRQLVRDLPVDLILARYKNRVVAGAVVLTFNEEAYYLYGASSSAANDVYASYLVQWEAITAARARSVRRYDMWGIPCEPRKDHPLWGVYQFKKKFGGFEERYVGAHERRLHPVRARIAREGIKGYYTLQRVLGRTTGPMSD